MLRALNEHSRRDATEVRTWARSETLDVERRIEDWLVCYLEDQEPTVRETSLLDLLAAGDLGADGVLKQADQGRRRSETSKRRRPRTRHWARIGVKRCRSIVLVKLLDQLLIKENVIDELAEDLGDLVRAGFRRLVLNFSAVERMSSRIVAVVVDLMRRCSERADGMIKLCGLRPELAEVFTLAGLDELTPMLADETAALEGSWPGLGGPRSLPISILSALTGPERRSASGSGLGWGSNMGDGQDGEEEATAPRLVTATGRETGRVVVIRDDRVLVGRGPECRLRASSALLSRQHAAIERHGRALRVRDLGSTNGTLVNGRVHHNDVVVLADGDRLQFGPLVFTVVLPAGGGVIGNGSGGGSGGGGGPRRRAKLDDLVVGWIADDEAEPEDGGGRGDASMGTVEVDSAAAQTMAGEDVAATGEVLADLRLMFEVVQDVLIVTPQAQRLDEAETIDQLRIGLIELFHRPLPRLVVVNLDLVTHISSRLVGVLLSHFLRLERAGGSLRVCQLHARVLSVLEQYRLPLLMEVFSNVDEAVITSWGTDEGA